MFEVTRTRSMAISRRGSRGGSNIAAHMPRNGEMPSHDRSVTCSSGSSASMAHSSQRPRSSVSLRVSTTSRSLWWSSSRTTASRAGSAPGQNIAVGASEKSSARTSDGSRSTAWPVAQSVISSEPEAWPPSGRRQLASTQARS
jgi:hypothetical protein